MDGALPGAGPDHLETSEPRLEQLRDSVADVVTNAALHGALIALHINTNRRPADDVQRREWEHVFRNFVRDALDVEAIRGAIPYWARRERNEDGRVEVRGNETSNVCSALVLSRLTAGLAVEFGPTTGRMHLHTELLLVARNLPIAVTRGRGRQCVRPLAEALRQYLNDRGLVLPGDVPVHFSVYISLQRLSRYINYILKGGIAWIGGGGGGAWDDDGSGSLSSDIMASVMPADDGDLYRGPLEDFGDLPLWPRGGSDFA